MKEYKFSTLFLIMIANKRRIVYSLAFNLPLLFKCSKRGMHYNMECNIQLFCGQLFMMSSR